MGSTSNDTRNNSAEGENAVNGNQESPTTMNAEDDEARQQVEDAIQLATDAEANLLAEKGENFVGETTTTCPPNTDESFQGGLSEDGMALVQEAEAAMLAEKMSVLRHSYSVAYRSTAVFPHPAVSRETSTTSGQQTIPTTNTSSTNGETGPEESSSSSISNRDIIQPTESAVLLAASVPIRLERCHDNRRQSQPGAVAIGGGADDYGGEAESESEESSSANDVEVGGGGRMPTALEGHGNIDDHLVSAHLVLGDDGADVVEAKSMEFRWRELATHPKVLAMLCLVVVIAVGVAVGVTMSRNKDSGNSQEEEIWVVQEPFDPTLPNDTLEAIRVPFSPQALANRWMLEHINLQQNFSKQRQKTRFGLAVLFYALNGDEWADKGKWLEKEVHECDWGSRFALDDGDEEAGLDFHRSAFPNIHGNYTACPLNDDSFLLLVLAPAGLAGNLPTELSSEFFPDLIGLDMSWNHMLTGTLPLEIASMDNLREILLSSTGISGQVPSELGVMPNLKRFSCTSCKLNQTLPSELGLSQSLEILQLAANSLTGEIPTEIMSTESLRKLFLEENSLTGSITLGPQSSSLQLLSLTDNFLSGTIPPEINLLTGLRHLSVAACGLTGTLPDMSQLTRLTHLSLGENSITGTLPSELFAMTRLDLMSLDTTSLTGTIPSEIALLRSLSELWIQENAFHGQLPSTIGNMENLVAMGLSDCSFTGTIPSEFGNLVNMAEFWIEGTMITGSFPSEWCDLHATGYLADARVNCSVVECCETMSSGQKVYDYVP